MKFSLGANILFETIESWMNSKLLMSSTRSAFSSSSKYPHCNNEVDEVVWLQWMDGDYFS